ncbi:MAG TPA: acetyl-CoA carboxylase biotin carboxyl carrier protein [Geminicoccaceae bacterium]|jgi:acetyl-CoA carboxylase biotin carboxyl carrier protein|nr:acetyl-CoA carboxylase biotin carboxyl carrier protein [Geminicoccaceae bacterium]
MPKLEIDTDLIERLAELLTRTGLSEIELSEGESRIRVARNGAVAPSAAVAGAAVQGSAAQSAAAAPAAVDATHPGAVVSPMVGTAYLTPEPGAAPFVTVGGRVEEGQTLLIIEAMKVMNPVRATRGGRVTQIFIGNGDPVEYGEILLLIE